MSVKEEKQNAEYGSNPQDLEGYEYVKNEEFFDAEHSVENLYFLLYYNFNDSNIDHFMIRMAHVVDSWTHEECVEHCVELLHHISDSDGGEMSVEDLLTDYNYPPELSDAIKEIRSALKAEKEEGKEL